MTHPTNSAAVVADLGLPPLPKAQYYIEIYNDDGSVRSIDGYTAQNMREAMVAAALARSAAPAPDCGACPGDSSICTTACKLAEESPVAPAVEPSAEKVELPKLKLPKPRMLVGAHLDSLHVLYSAEQVESIAADYARDAIAASRRTAGDALTEAEREQFEQMDPPDAPEHYSDREAIVWGKGWVAGYEASFVAHKRRLVESAAAPADTSDKSKPCRNVLMRVGYSAVPKACPRCGLAKECPAGHAKSVREGGAAEGASK